MVQLRYLITLMKASIHFKMAQFIKDSGKIDKGMDTEYRYGQMVRDMKVSGIRIKLMEEVFSIMLMATYLMDSGSMIKLMDLVHITMLTEVNMKVNGLTIYRMVKVKKPGKISQRTKEVIIKVRSMEQEYMFGQMAVYIMGNGLIIKFKVMEFISGQMVEFIMENGLIIKCMDQDL